MKKLLTLGFVTILLVGLLSGCYRGVSKSPMPNTDAIPSGFIIQSIDLVGDNYAFVIKDKITGERFILVDGYESVAITPMKN